MRPGELLGRAAITVLSLVAVVLLLSLGGCTVGTNDITACGVTCAAAGGSVKRVDFHACECWPRAAAPDGGAR